MGYGKTTAIREAFSSDKVTSHWLRVFTNDAQSFWNDFSELVGALDSGCGESLIRLGLPNDVVSMNEALKLLSHLKLSEPAVIVVDDYHNVDSAELNKFFELLSEREVSGLHIILTARHTKFRRLEELKLKKNLYHITNEAFELQPPEIVDYFNTCGIPLSGEQSLSLYGITEGWISALYLFLLEYVSGGGFTNSESIYRLLEKVINTPMPDETKSLLLAMCIFDNFTLKQAEYVWRESSALSTLSGLVESNLFVAYDGRSNIYYIHRIFLDFLREELDKRIGYKMELYKRAAAWFVKSGNYQKAREYSFLCGDFDGLLTALEKDVAIDYSVFDKDDLKKYITACPDEIKAHHHLAMLKTALPMLIHNEREMFGKICDGLENNIDRDTGVTTEFLNSINGELELLKGLASFNELHEMSFHYKKAWDLLQRPTSIYCKKIHWNFGSPSILYLYHRESGKLKSNVLALKEGLPLYIKLTDGHGAGGEFIMEAEYYFNTGDFENAEISLRKAILAAQSADESNIMLCAEFLQIRLDFLRGDGAAVFSRLSGMRATMADRKLYNYLHTVEICEGFVFAWTGNLAKLPCKLLETDPRMLRLGFPAIGMYDILLGKNDADKRRLSEADRKRWLFQLHCVGFPEYHGYDL